MKSIFKRSKHVAVIVLAVIVTILVLGAFDARRMPDLELWHTAELKSEFAADESNSNITFQTYLENEERLFQELQRLNSLYMLSLNTSQLYFPYYRFAAWW